ncbi:MAG: RecX family transcriptional regulator, partial [FCB group bacterium]|nr:RecX family transcriptional regulator [FCB group bacterium]
KTLLLERFALYCAESLLARRNYSVGEFKERLRQKEIGLDLIKQIVAEFRQLDLLDDFRYGQMRVRSVIRRKPAGRGFLIADLQKRLVPRDIAEKVVTEALKDSDEIEMAVELLEKRRAAFTKFDLETKRRKAYTYLSRRAISYGASKAAFDMVFGKTQK